MWELLGLLMKQQFQFPCIGSTLKVCILFIVLTATTSLACGSDPGGWVGGAGGDDKDPIHNKWQAYLKALAGKPKQFVELDEERVLNMSGYKGPVLLNTHIGWLGWAPANITLEWMNKWYDKFIEDGVKNGELTPQQMKKREKAKARAAKKAAGNTTVKASGKAAGNTTVKPELHFDFSAERGPANGWPDSPGWEDLGPGTSGTPVPPWAWGPRNVNRPYLCYLPPVAGNCFMFENITKERETRWGYNPLTNRCWTYYYYGCGGTRNNFFTKRQCENHCEHMPPASCSINSAFKAKSAKNG